MSAGDRSIVIISATSDIGQALCKRWLNHGWKLAGTYRSHTAVVDELQRQGMPLVHCNLLNPKSVVEACARLRTLSPQWDALVLCPGTQEPVGAFLECDFNAWEDSIRVNFTGQLHIIHEMLPTRRNNRAIGACVILFAGGGTNSAPVNYSAYTLSKIALIKACELLDAEVTDTRFAILGPGWVKTKIHEATLRAGSRAGADYQRTLEKLAGNELTPMDTVVDCCEWVIDASREQVSGRNFSVVHDQWGTAELEKRLVGEPDMYKLRRHGNTY